MARKKKKDNRTPRQIIVDMCRLLESFGVTRVTCEYDGHDYEGNIHAKYCDYNTRDETSATHLHYGGLRHVATDPHVTAAISARPLHDVLRDLETATPDKPALITREDAIKFENALENILPADWADEAGSYGEIGVNVIARKIDIAHTKRIIQAQNQKITYTDSVETPTVVDA